MVKLMAMRTPESDSNSMPHPSKESWIVGSQLDQPVTSSLNDEVICGRPWVRVLFDKQDNRPLASYVSLGRPSEIHTLMLLRSFVHRFGTFPKVLFIEDHKLHGCQLDAVAAYLPIVLKCSPVGHLLLHRGHIERFLANLTVDVLVSSHAKTKPLLLTEVRQLIETVLQHYKNWTLAVRHDFKEESQSKDAFQQVTYSPSVEVLTLPSTSGRTVPVSKTYDIIINHLRYSHPKLATSSIIGTQVPVRYHPEDVSVAYAFVDQEWIQLNCKNAPPVICSVGELQQTRKTLDDSDS